MIRFISTLLVIFLLSLSNSSFGQGSTDSIQVVTTKNLSNQMDMANRSKPTIKSPLGAVIRSLAVPGWGQLYVQQYWKAPIFLAGAIVMYYYVFKHNKDYLDYSRQYDRLKEINPNSIIELHYLKLKIENSRDNRDISIFFLCGVYALAMLDSYVDAHLFNFNVSESLSFGITNRNDGVFLSLQFRR